MSDDKTKRGGPDRRRVNPGEEYEVRHEAKKMGVPKEKVKDAADKAGPMRDKVEKEIRSH
jgi:hypothetical protein